MHSSVCPFHAMFMPVSYPPNSLPTVVQWGTARNISTLTGKASSFLRLAGNPAQSVTNGKMAHILRSVGSTALTFATVAQGGIDIAWCVVRLFSRLPPVVFSFRMVWYRTKLFFPGNWKLGMGCMCGHRHRVGGRRSSGKLA